ncbi:MAG: DUF2752 domain-containing protein [Bacteroidales bacterium]|nr:DUF2752 domain-containing protein [Candidatus Liminaster caballi]
MKWIIPVLALSLIFTFYYFVDVSEGGIGIPCVWHQLTHTQCPSCGMQRFLSALVHGRFIEAISYNYFLIVALPYAALCVITVWYDPRHRFEPLRRVLFSANVLRAFVVIFFGWWIVRNILGI